MTQPSQAPAEVPEPAKEKAQKPAKAPKGKKAQGKATAAFKAGKGKGNKSGKSARQHAIEILKAHGNRMKFGELVNEVSKRMGGKLSWTPTYYLHSPGFHSGTKAGEERGMVRYDPKEAEKGHAATIAKRIAAVKAAHAAKKAKKGKGKQTPEKAGKKGETVLERRQRTARELKEKQEDVKREFDEAVAANNSKANGTE